MILMGDFNETRFDYKRHESFFLAIQDRLGPQNMFLFVFLFTKTFYFEF